MMSERSVVNLGSDFLLFIAIMHQGFGMRRNAATFGSATGRRHSATAFHNFLDVLF